MLKKFKRIYVEITNVCNLKCRFCDVTSRKQEFMKIEDVEKVFKEIKKHTDYVCLHVKGEPLLHPNLKKTLELAEVNDLQVIITTNGTLIKNNVEILSKSSAIRQINISLHSIEENPNLKIDRDKYFKELFDNVEKITRSNDCYISYRLWNLENVSEYEKDREILYYLKEYYNIVDLFKQLKKCDFLKISDRKYINLDTIYEWPSLEKEVISGRRKCYGLLDQLAILVDGTVVPCCMDQNGDINLGNIFEKSLEDILKSELATRIVQGFRDGKLIHELCKKCGFRKVKIS